jgi:hypothetical protein
MAKRSQSQRKAKLQIELSEADQEALAFSCRAEPHHPFSLKFVDAPGGVVFPHASVRTTSWEWDGCGGRTDLHEMLALLWAMILRARGTASAGFLDEGGFVGPREIYARVLYFLQPFDRFFAAKHLNLAQLLAAHTAVAAHELYHVLGLTSPEEQEPKWQEETLPWLQLVRDHLGGEDANEMFVERRNPDWRYYFAPGSFVSILELPPRQMSWLRHACRHYAPVSSSQGNRLIVSAGGIYNAISRDALRKGERLLQALDQSPFTRVGDGCARWDSAAMVVPLENRVVILGGTFLVSVATLCGYRQYLVARDRWEEKHREAALIFGQSGTIEWREPLNSERFADLAEALLRVEPDVIRVRSSGPHNERDQGRDIIVDRPGVALMENQAVTGLERIVVQVKVRNRTVGKHHVQDIRDTIEHHRSHGYLLIAFPRLSSDLIHHLEGLEERGLSVDWWTRTQLEERIRRHPNIAAQFTDLLTHHATREPA